MGTYTAPGIRVARKPTYPGAAESTGQRLKQLRNRLQLTQAEVAAQLGVHRSLVAQYEGGYLRLNADLIIRLAAILKTSPNELLGSEPLKSERPIRNRALFRRFKEVDRLPAADQKVLARFLDALLVRHGLGEPRPSRKMTTKEAKRFRT